MSANPQSACCAAPIRVEGRTTLYYVCSKCKEPCNPDGSQKATVNSDEEMRRFLKMLDASDADISDWEMEFIESNLTRDHFSPKQRETVNKMIERYGKRIKYL